MSNVVHQFTSLALGDHLVYDDLTCVSDGLPNPTAVVSVSDGTYRLALNASSIIHMNPVPDLGRVLVTRVPGWQGALGYKVELLDQAAGVTPNAIAWAVYGNPDGTNYQYTTGAMVFVPATGYWTATCPAGFEPGANTFYGGFLYGSLQISVFAMQSQWNEQTFQGGGDWAGTVALQPARSYVVGPQVNPVLTIADPQLSPEGHEIAEIGLTAGNRIWLKLAGGVRDSADPTVTIQLPSGSVSEGLIWQASQSRYRSAPVVGLRLLLLALAGGNVVVSTEWS